MPTDFIPRAWSRRMVRADGVSLHVVTAGPPDADKPPILFVHGFPEFWYAWKDQLRVFGTERQAAALDMRGYGWSDRPREVGAYAMPNLVTDIGAVLDDLSPDRPPILVGHDWGGVVAWHFAAQHPDRLARLVIINAPHPAVFARELMDNPAQRLASAYVALFRSPVAESLMRVADFAFLRRIVFGLAAPGAFSAEDRRRYRQAWAQTGALTGGLNYYRAVHFDPKIAARPIHVPTLVIWGEKDPALLTGNLRGLGEYVPDLTVVRIPDGSHWVVHEYPEQINAAILGVSAMGPGVP